MIYDPSSFSRRSPKDKPITFVCKQNNQEVNFELGKEIETQISWSYHDKVIAKRSSVGKGLRNLVDWVQVR